MVDGGDGVCVDDGAVAVGGGCLEVFWGGGVVVGGVAGWAGEWVVGLNGLGRIVVWGYWELEDEYGTSRKLAASQN